MYALDASMAALALDTSTAVLDMPIAAFALDASTAALDTSTAVLDMPIAAFALDASTAALDTSTAALALNTSMVALDTSVAALDASTAAANEPPGETFTTWFFILVSFHDFTLTFDHSFYIHILSHDLFNEILNQNQVYV